MESMKKCLDLVSQNKHLLKEDIDFEELILRMNRLKAGSASLLVSDGMKVSEALKEVNISNGMVKKVNDKSVYHTAKMTKCKINNHPNKGKKLVRNMNGDTQYVDVEVYEQLLANGKLSVKSKKNATKSKKKKGSTIRGGALVNGNIDELLNGSSVNCDNFIDGDNVDKLVRASDKYRNI